MTMLRLRTLLPLTLAASLHFACGSSESPAGPAGSSDPTAPNDVAACSVAGRTGKSSCQADTPPGFPAKPPISCSAGTFCTAVNYDAKCQAGCESDENCGATERCVRCGSGAGKCRTCTITDEEACAAPAKPDAAAPVACERNTFFDQDCTSPGKAFACPTTLEPTGQGTCALTKTPGIWCCGGEVKTCERETFIDQTECNHPGPNGPRPPKGYACEPDSEPSDPKCVQGDIASHWCCPQ